MSFARDSAPPPLFEGAGDALPPGLQLLGAGGRAVRRPGLSESAVAAGTLEEQLPADHREISVKQLDVGNSIGTCVRIPPMLAMSPVLGF